MSLERIIKALRGFGLKRIEAEVYVYLAKKGPQKGRDLADALNIRKQQLYPILKKLEEDGLILSEKDDVTLKRIYNLTNDGRDFLVSLKDSMQDFVDIIQNMIHITEEG